MSDLSERALSALGIVPGLGGGIARPVLWFKIALESERDRWFLWLPALFGLGIGLYFSLLIEPPLWLGLVASSLALVAAVFAWRRGRFAALAIGTAAIVLGFAAAEIETWAVAAPVLEAEIGPVFVEGRVVEVEPLVGGGRRIVVEPRSLGRLSPDRLPARIRITLRGDEGAPLPGEGVA